MSLKILITIPQFTPETRAVLDAVGSVTEATPTQEELLAMVEPYEIIVAGLGLRFDRAVLERASRLHLLATATTGLDHIDTAGAAERGIAVVSLKGEKEFLQTITGTAELAWGLLLALLRQIPSACDSVRSGEWQRERFRGHELSGKMLGIVGYGRLGSMVARYGAAFGMRVIACDPRPSDAVAMVPFPALLQAGDVVSLHVPYDAMTRHLVDAAALARMQPTAMLINTSRGGIVDEVALLEALERGRIAGYAADVLDGEAAFGAYGCGEHPLITYAKTHTNVVIAPHIGGMTHESRRATDVFIAEKVTHWVREYEHAQI